MSTTLLPSLTHHPSHPTSPITANAYSNGHLNKVALSSTTPSTTQSLISSRLQSIVDIPNGEEDDTRFEKVVIWFTNTIKYYRSHRLPSLTLIIHDGGLTQKIGRIQRIVL
jgi:hypothetical protein